MWSDSLLHCEMYDTVDGVIVAKKFEVYSVTFLCLVVQLCRLIYILGIIICIILLDLYRTLYTCSTVLHSLISSYYFQI